MVLRNLIPVEPGDKPVDIHIREGVISGVTAHSEQIDPGSVSLAFRDAIIFPGLINSHDHLEFDLYPMLGEGGYGSYLDWSTDIHRRHDDLIASIEKIPPELRYRWGIYKNLLAGVTTVMQHGKLHPLPGGKDSSIHPVMPIDVVQNCQTLHSVRLQQWWRLRLNLPLRHLHRWWKTPVVLHVGEGINELAREEVDKLLHWNLFKRPLIAVHGVAMSQHQAAGFRALVWCPVSNHFLFSRTAPVKQLKDITAVLFGTDSTLTGEWNFWHHLRLARRLNQLTDRELYQSVTTEAARVWELPCQGGLTPGNSADVVVARKRLPDAMESFFSLNPQDMLLILKKGHPVLWDADLKNPLTAMRNRKAFTTIRIGRTLKYVWGDVAGLLEQIRRYHPAAEFPVTIARERGEKWN